LRGHRPRPYRQSLPFNFHPMTLPKPKDNQVNAFSTNFSPTFPLCQLFLSSLFADGPNPGDVPLPYRFPLAAEALITSCGEETSPYAPFRPLTHTAEQTTLSQFPLLLIKHLYLPSTRLLWSVSIFCGAQADLFLCV